MPEVINLLKISGLGGVQTQMISFFRHLRAHPSEVRHRLLAVHGFEDHFRDLEEFRISWPAAILRARLRNTIVHSHNTLTSGRYLKLWTLLRPRNLVLHEHGNIWNVDPKDPTVIGSARCARIVIANSHATGEMLEHKFGIPREKIRVIHNGVFSEVPDLGTREATGEVTIGYLGRLEYFKGVHVLIEAFRRLPDRVRTAARLRIIGDGPELPRLRALADGDDRIEFLGKRNDVPELLRGLDIVVAPSIREPLGNSIIEAGLFRRPVIAANVDGIPEIITGPREGILLTPSRPLSPTAGKAPVLVYSPEERRLVSPRELDPADLEQSLRRLIAAADERRILGNNLFDAVRDRFSIPWYVDRLDSLYREILGT
jgi:glycosyltransferase involved in cell wall biosynthesis